MFDVINSNFGSILQLMINTFCSSVENSEITHFCAFYCPCLKNVQQIMPNNKVGRVMTPRICC